MDSELQQWLEMLRSPNVDDRLVAVKTLQHIGDEEILTPLLEAVNDESPLVQKLAITTLWELANPAAVPALLECLASPAEDVRNEARSALSELIVPDHLLLLLDALLRDDVNLQLNILFLLRKIHDAQCLHYVMPFFESPVPELREAAITTLRYLNQVVRCQPALALMSDPDEAVRRTTALTLGHLADDQVIPILAQAVTDDPDWEVRRNAAKSLTTHANPHAIAALEKAAEDPHWQVRKFSIQALQTIAAERTLPLFIKALTDEYSDVRREGVKALKILNNPVALTPLQQALDDPDRDVCIFAQRAIQSIQASNQETSNV
jgi:HEAT repeat protein